MALAACPYGYHCSMRIVSEHRWRQHAPHACAAPVTRRQPAAAATSAAAQARRFATRNRCCAATNEAGGNLSSWQGDAPVLSDEEDLSSFNEEPRSANGASGGSEQQPSSNVHARSVTSGSSSSSSGDGGGLQRDRWRVPLPPHLHGKAPRKHWNANALAFLGDSVWELYARRRFFYPPSSKDSYFGLVVHHVRAETQEKLYKQLLSSGWLTDAERDVLRWGRNATGVTPKRLSDTGLKRETYRAATAMECLCGYMYLSDPDRLHEMMGLLGLGDVPGDGAAGAAAAAASQAPAADVASAQSDG